MAAKQVSSRTVVLAAVAVVAAVVLVAIWPRGTADTTGSAPQGSRPQTAGQADPAVPEPLGLGEISGQRSVPANRRDLFRFGASQPAPNPDAAGGEAQPAAPAGRSGRSGRSGRGVAPPPETPVDVQPPAPAPIPLRYVGYAEDKDKTKIAALSDGRSTFHGREGDVIEGRWRIVKIGVESIVLERVDGTGRQTIRLAGG